MYSLNKNNNNFQPKNDYGFYSTNSFSSTSMRTYKVIIVN